MRTRHALTALALSAAALVGIANHESFRGVAYFATAEEKAKGISTIGFGTTEGVKPGDKISVEKALERKLQDVVKFEGAIKQCVKVPLHTYEYDAYVSLAYNIGEGAFCSSTLVRKLNAEDYAGACAEISRWTRQGNKELAGLVKRRAKERAMCEGKLH